MIFNKGDFIEIDGNAGIIQSISSQGTTLMDYDGNNIFIPNFKFAFDEVNISTEFVPISNQNKMHDHRLEFFKNYYSLDKIIKINQFVVLKK